MVLLRLTPEQVSRFWPTLQDSIERAMPPTHRATDGMIANTLQRLMAGTMEAWVAYDKIDVNPKVCGFCTTYIEDNALDGTKSLLIFSVYLYSSMGMQGWEDCYRTLLQYARGKGCRSITFYTENPDVISIAKKFGFCTSYTFGSVDIASCL